ncbi:MAG: hypothetical protein K2Y10_00110 [Burkholderiaceae bacterium]|nr:hypothetical protein [Burkholderiaceae bacterium]
MIFDTSSPGLLDQRSQQQLSSVASKMQASPGIFQGMTQQQISEAMNKMIAGQASGADSYANHLIDRRNVYDGIEDGLIKEANNYDSDARMGREVGRAKGDVEQSFSTALGQMQRQMASTGADPTSGAALAAMRQLTAQKALGIAGAANAARRTIEDSAFQRRMAVGGLGKGLNADITNSQAAAGKLGETAMTGLMDAQTRKESAAASMASAAASGANAAANMALANSKLAFDREQFDWSKNNLTKAQQEDVAYRNKTADANIAYSSGNLQLNKDKQAAADVTGVVNGVTTLLKDGTLGKAAELLTGGPTPTPALVDGKTFSETAAQNQSSIGIPTVSGIPTSAPAAQAASSSIIPEVGGFTLPDPTDSLASGTNYALSYVQD